MGNTGSTAAGNNNQSVRAAAQPQSLNTPAQNSNNVRTPSISPGPGNPHPSMRHKKRSLELPDLATLQPSPYAGRVGVQQTQQYTPPIRSAAIAIPVSPANQNPFNHYQHANEIDPPQQRTTVILPSTTDMRFDYQHQQQEQAQEPPEREAQALPQASTHQQPVRSRAQRHQERQERQERHRDERAREVQPRGRQQPNAAAMRLQQMWDSSHEPPAPPSSPAGPSYEPPAPRRGGRPREVVRSSIPIALTPKEKKAPEVVTALVEEPVYEPSTTKIIWKGGGTEVILARAGDDEWKGRQVMPKDPDEPNTWSLNIDLLPGTHHLRFLVDNIWRVSTDLPTAVDDQGSLANYVAVPFPVLAAPAVPNAATPADATTNGDASTTPATAPPGAPTIGGFAALTSATPGGGSNIGNANKNLNSGPSFWSTGSSADGDEEIDPRMQKNLKNHPHASPAAVAYIQAKWTDVLPLELLEAAREEEAYLNASAGQYDSGAGSMRVTGFVPAPNIPPAPGLPRHLDKLILNSKVGEQKGSGSGSAAGSSGSPRRGGKKELAASGGSGTGIAGGVGSGQGGGRRERRDREERRERERGERERGERERGERERGDREREQRATRSRRGNVPPAPPPSETGDDDVEETPTTTSAYAQHVLTQSPYMPAQLLKHHQQPMLTSANVQANLMGNGNGQNSSFEGPVGPPSSLASSSGTAFASVSTGSSGVSGATTPQQGSGGSATPTGQMSPHQTPPKAAAQWGYTGSPRVGGGPGSNGSNGSGGGALGSPNSISGGGSGVGSGPGSATLLSPPPLLSNSRAITIDDANMPTLTDDNSVLPVPSHVVLHHLCTSAIKNGVLAVANTTRYKKKYLTTIYYKPT